MPQCIQLKQHCGGSAVPPCDSCVLQITPQHSLGAVPILSANPHLVLHAFFEQEECSAAQKLTEVLADQATSKLSSDPPQPPSSSLAPSSCSKNATVWKDVRPKVKERDKPMTSKTLLKPPQHEEIGFPSPKPPEALEGIHSYDMLVTCASCNIILPLPTLQKHEVRSDRSGLGSYT